MKKDNPVIRPATPADIIDFYGMELPVTVRAWAVDYKGETVCLAGVTIHRNMPALAFSELRDHDAPPITVYRTAIKLMEKIKTLRMKVIADPANNPLAIACNAPRFLRALGFTEQEGGLYIWDN